MKLVIPIFRNDKIYTDVDIKEPTPEVIVRAEEIVKKGLTFKAILEFVSGSIEALYSSDDDIITDKAKIKRICGMMPFISAETLSMKIMCLINENDFIEGVYSCPRCGEKIITGKDDIEDTRDRINELDIIYADDFMNKIYVDLPESVKIKNVSSGEVLEEIQNFSIRYPVLNDCILAENGQTNETRIQLRIYCNALTEINGVEINKDWISQYGMLLINKLKICQLYSIPETLQKYGIKKTKQRTCFNCNKTWEAPLNTSNFFVSGLHAT